MSQVYSLPLPASRASAPSPKDLVSEFIDSCYEKLEMSPDFSRRPGQRDLSVSICKALVAAKPIAAQAPTGTGKTLAYLIGAIAASRQLGALQEMPVVIATATVGLQGQIMQGDLPRLINAGLIQAKEVSLAKGRGRYFCAQSAEAFLEANPLGGQDDFFNADKNDQRQDCWDADELLTAWRGNAWNGDIDHYGQAAPKVWPIVAANSETCTAHRCEHYNSCAFFKARRELSSAKVVVANHDFVLADLQMRKDGKDPVLPGKAYFVVFDEAHHLPAKALEAGTGELRTEKLLAVLGSFKHYGSLWAKSSETARMLQKAKLDAHDFEPQQLATTLNAVVGQLATLPYDLETNQFRFEGGVLPAGISSEMKLAERQAERLLLSLQEAQAMIKSSKLAENNERLGPIFNDILRTGAPLVSIISEVHRSLELLTAKGRHVRWAFCPPGGVPSMHVCPLEGGDVLKSLLWDGSTHRVALVSATLTDFTGFGRFKEQCGYEHEWLTTALDHVFPYHENSMYLVEMRHSPKQEERAEFIRELCRALPAAIDSKGATLVLFPSKSLMTDVLPALRAKFEGAVLAQGEKGFKALVATHKERIDQGKGSILCGLATMAEGLDLPGHYCTHVAICALPFTVPTTPVELEQKAILGRDYFAVRAMPDALTKLTQMVGRLMRRETDRGAITIFDNRISRTRWGRQLLDALPPFKKQSLQVGASLPVPAPVRVEAGPVLDFVSVVGACFQGVSLRRAQVA